MEPNYLVGYTLFGAKYNGFSTRYMHFETKEEALKFIRRQKVNEFEYVLYKRIKDTEE